MPIGGGYGGGNQFLWHQDFWYWGAGNGPLKNNEGSPNVSPFPDLATCFIAFTPCNRFNGGLEVRAAAPRPRPAAPHQTRPHIRWLCLRGMSWDVDKL